ncbi:l-isoaspartate o-methyltransferase [Fusarium sporotrichioides]|uniref:L-isoaspartate o-methyltransferase n=1 Tax=Fusarium sporotrichioides TaxID=5514 RepID=A0A395RUY6_FUSSP|nr:l-isoaspartate o-methyltransferase [Fusarium sporotrichioides]
MELSTIEQLKTHVTPFKSIPQDSDTITKYFDSFGDYKILLIGDASHGTSEFYSVRAEITKYMIENHGFNMVAVEADWPDAEHVDRYVRNRPGPGQGAVEPIQMAEKEKREPPFLRFPTWLWRNVEVHDFVEWMRSHNSGRKVTEAAGFYGLDLYSMGTSMKAVIDYLDTVDKDMAKVARGRYVNLMDWLKDPHEYGLESLGTSFKGYEANVVAMLEDLLKKRIEYSAALDGGAEFHNGEQNARVVQDAEQYYKAMYRGQDKSWNLRDTHMFETLKRVLEHWGVGSKAIVWAHNSHIGDARATSMSWASHELNIGELCKRAFGDDALSIGTGTNTGTVAAAQSWESDMNIMKVQPGLPGSYEELMHATGISNFVLDLRKGECDEKLREALRRERLERSIGVIYKPETEKASHYSHAILPDQFDGYIWFDESKHVGTLEVHQPRSPLEYHETWPFGL